jgi:S-adenosylmethionine:tRNA ribosyltransferase-isomerase
MTITVARQLDERPLTFDLPPELEAHEPPEARGLSRDEVRLMVSHYRDDRIAHAQFTDLPALLEPGDLLVANDSATIPAALTARRRDGQEVVIHLSSRRDEGLWVVEPRQVALGLLESLELPGGGRITFLAPYAHSRRLWLARLDLPNSDLVYLHQWGQPIRYPYLRDEWPLEYYQTVYAREPGSAEMPSAGRAFSADVLSDMNGRGIEFRTLTLHTGVASLEAHERPYEEHFSVPPETAVAVNLARRDGRRVIAVGTTVVRTLESAADGYGDIRPKSGWTSLIVTPERGVRVIDGLLTGFHEPQASHLDMLSAIAGKSHLAVAYRAALEGRYLWHEFGDLHLILP